MGTVPYALGRELRFFAKKETALGGNFGTSSQEVLVGGSSGNAAKVTASDINYSIERVNREDSIASRSMLERVTGKEEITWSAESYILPRGGTTVPDIDPLLEAAFGIAFGTGTARTYELSEGSAGTTGLPSLHIARLCPAVFREDIFGAWVNEWGLSVSGGDIPKMTFSGGAMHYAMTGSGTTGTGASSTATLPTTSGGAVNFMKGSTIAITDVAGEHIVTSVTTDSLTLAATTTFGSAKAILPGNYTEGTGGSPVGGTAGEITIGGTAFDVLSFDVSMSNGIKAVTDEAFNAGATDYFPMQRSVTGTVTIRAKQTDIKAFAARTTAVAGVLTHPTTAINVTIGSTTATAGAVGALKVKVLMPTCELDFSNISVPAAEEAVLNIPFTALGSSGGDEISFKWNE